MEDDQVQNFRRKRRRKRRLQGAVLYIAIAIGLAWFFESQATTTIIFVRHAEKNLSVEDDPELTEAGQRRVFELTRQMKDADVVAGIDAIYSTHFRRNLATVEPLSELLELPINLYNKNEYEKNLLKKINELRKYFKNINKDENYAESLTNLADAKKVIFEFFDNVKVNDEDTNIKKNRLELLQMLCRTFDNYIKFSNLETK